MYVCDHADLFLLFGTGFRGGRSAFIVRVSVSDVCHCPLIDEDSRCIDAQHDMGCVTIRFICHCVELSNRFRLKDQRMQHSMK